ncbi:hypothetical protein DXG01_015810 [Tephrocybe rancida]|nr:hypothetical protein DXG01_015810 [Tephrocybe rancida]
MQPRLKRPSKWPEEEEEIKTVPKVGPRLDNAGKDITTDTDSGPSRDLMDKHNAEHRDAALQERLAQQKTQAREENLAAESKTRRDQGLERNEFAAARRREAADSRVAYLAREAKREAARLAAQEAARAREAQRVATEREALRRREARERQEAARQVQLAEQEALRFKEEAAVTSQHLVLKGSTRITCRAGLEIQNVVTGFESCRLTIRNIPSDAKRTEILDLFTQQGLRRDDVHIISFKFVDGDLFEAQILMHDEQGRVLALGLDGIEFRNKILRFEAGDDTLAHAMGESSSRQIDTLTITWPAPSRSIIARYNTMEAAEAYARYLNGIEVKEGRRIKAEMNQPPSGPALRYYIPSSVRIWGVPVEVPLEAIIACARTESVRELMPKFLVSTKFYREIRAHLRTLPHIRLIGFDFDGTSIDGISTARARFESWDQAQLARTSLEAQRTPWPHMNLRLYLPQPLYFVSTISDQQYTAQKRLWDSLDGAGEGDAGRVKIQHMPDKGVVRIQLSGDDKKIVGALKVRVETLAAGERLDASHWHRGFLAPDGRAFLATLFSLSGAFVRVDYKVLALRVYGEEAAKQRARRRIWRKISDLAFQEKTVFLKRRSVGYFVRTGLAALKEICGEGSVILDLASAPCTITVRGGEEARHALNTHIDESLVDRPTPNTGDICPICYDEATHPIKLGCKHIYCTACLRHYLTSAPETKLFPLFCMGDETRCKVPIPIPTIKRFFNHQQYEELVDIAFSTYIGNFDTAPLQTALRFIAAPA